MKQKRKKSNVRRYHKWTALFISFFLLLFALSGLVLNHRNLFSPVDVNRKWLPSVYRYDNWNLAGVKSSVEIAENSVLVYGNIGMWITDTCYSSFKEYTKGFPKGIDNRKIFTITVTGNGHIYAGSRSGLYLLDMENDKWKSVELPVKENLVVGMAQKADSLYVMTRSNILVSADTGHPAFTARSLPVAENYNRTETLFRTLWIIHSGKIYGLAGKLIVDAMAVILISLIISGFIYWLTPGLLRRITGNSLRSGLKRTNRSFMKWHNTVGYLTVVFLIIITLTGMFLRPPLLIPVAGSRVPLIKGSWLDNPNPWFDKLRDIIWDDDRKIFLYSTSEGIYFSGPEPDSLLRAFKSQPPVSVMGVNVFEKAGPGEYLVGSFSGLYRWNPDSGIVTDHLTGLPVTVKNGLTSPFGNVAVAGKLNYYESEIIFDYTRGVIIGGNTAEFPPMPDNVKAGSPMPLWNLALEIHTGRYLFPIIGNFYILYIPVIGISTLVVLVTGFLIWWRKRRKKAECNGPVAKQSGRHG